MINKLPEEQWTDPTKTVLEPSCGDGNFIEWVIRKKIEWGSTIKQAIKTTELRYLSILHVFCSG